MEIEVKYLNGAQTAGKVLKSSVVAPYLNGRKTVKMSAVYYDTKNAELSTAGFALRLRGEGDATVCALKGGKIENGIACRLEIEVAADNVLQGWGKITRHADFPDALAPMAHAAEFIETAAMSFTRELCRYERGDLACELAQDSGEICAGGRTCAIDEFEIELLHGEQVEFLEFIERIEHENKLVRGEKSKYARAMELKGANNA